MGDDHQYQIYFECDIVLSEEQKRKITKYFQIKRKSGGGECSAVEDVSENIYRTAFRHQKDQQSVLQRTEHVVHLTEGRLKLTIKESLDHQPFGHASSSSTHPVQVLKSAQKEFHQNQHQESKRIVLLGKTGSGKSSLGNTILGEDLLTTSDSPSSGTETHQSETRDVNGRKITLIDTPGLFDTEKSDEALKPEIMRCVTDFAPGIHAFLILLKVERYSEHEQAVISRILEYFSEDTLKYTVIIFTFGDKLREGMKIEEFVRQNQKLSDLVERCGGRCHVFDNKYWNNNTQQNDYRSNHFQREELLKTIDKLTEERNGECYTNEMLQAVERKIQTEEENIRKSSPENLSAEEIRNQASNTVSNRLLIEMAGLTTGVLLGALFGVETLVRAVSTCLSQEAINQGKEAKGLMRATAGVEVASAAEAFEAAGFVGAASATAAIAGAKVVYEAAASAGAVSGGKAALVATVAVAGGVIGGAVGHEAAQEAETVQDAVKKAAKAVMEKRQSYTLP